MTGVHESRVGVAHREASRSWAQEKPTAQRADHSTIREALLPVVRLSWAVITWPAVAVGRLFLRSQSNRISGYRRSGYPEMDHWMAGRRHHLDK